MSIVVEKLSFAYGSHPVLRDVSFCARSGRLLAVLGPNGAGKTTLFRCILGLQQGKQGSVLVAGREARALSPRQLAGLVAYIPQTHGQVFDYRVADMVLMGAAHALAPFALPGKKEKERAMEALCRLGIKGLGGQSFSRISGGEQQLVLIARALAQQVKILLMDEPTASLDYGNQNRVLAAVRGLAGEGYTVVVSTHNPQHALWYGHDALALLNGRVEAFGPVESTVTQRLLLALYGMEAELVQTERGPLIAPAPPREGT